MEEIGCKCQTFFISLSSGRRKQTACQIFGFPDSSVGKELPSNAGDPSLIPGSERSPGEGIGYPPPVFLDFHYGLAGKESACDEEDLDSIPGLGKIPWRRERLPTPVFWPGEFHGLYSPWGRKESDMTE